MEPRPAQLKSPPLPSVDDLLSARRLLAGRVSRTPVRREQGLDQALGCRLWLKCENLQHTGAFKLRGATHALARLEERGLAGDVATHSSGNHGAALACAARRAGRRAHVVMPRDAVSRKIEAVRSYGGEVVLCEPGQAPRERGLAGLVRAGCIPVPPYDHPDIIAGQGTAALELFEETGPLDVLLTPLGGGGLLAGSALAAEALGPGTQLFGVEPAGAADAHASLRQGERVAGWQPDTVADGLRALVGHSNFELISQRVEDILLVEDHDTIAAMRLMLELTGLRLEPSAAVVIAAIRQQPEIFAGRRVGVILSGGNYDPTLFPWLETAETAAEGG